MAKYIVSVCRVSYAHRDIEIEAGSPEWAIQKAREQCGNHEYTEKDAEYKVEHLAEIKPDGERVVPEGFRADS